MERTLVLIKPDGVQRALTGEIISRLERRGLKIIGGKFMQVSMELAEAHYGEHVGKSFYNGLVKYITSSPLMALVLEGPEAIAVVRQTMGATNPAEADPGTVRHDFGLITSRNLTHASANEADAKREIELWFKEDELFDWMQANDHWILGKN